MDRLKPVALFDLDGTLCDYVSAILAELEKLRSPNEPVIDPFEIHNDSSLQYLWDRMDLIRSSEEWWANLPRLQMGFDVLGMAKELGYQYEVLTQGARDNPAALAGKLRWIRANLGDDVDYTMTRNKSRHYGRVFVDDFPGYIKPWLQHRPRGQVIMPANKYNRDFSHPQVIRYTGENKQEVYSALEKAIKNSE